MPACMASASIRPTARCGARCSVIRAMFFGSIRRPSSSEIYEPPFPGFGPRGFDIDRNGIAYVPLSSGHLGAFDRRKCKGPLNGPQAAEGKMCPEGWTLTPFPGPQFRDVAESGSAEASYYTWVDQFNTSGLGANTPMATGNANESIMALVDGKWVNMRVPYPLGFFAKYDRRPHRRSECGLEGPRRYGRPTATGRRSIAKPARAPCPRSSSSRSGPTRWRTDRTNRAGRVGRPGLPECPAWRRAFFLGGSGYRPPRDATPNRLDGWRRLRTRSAGVRTRSAVAVRS